MDAGVFSRAGREIDERTIKLLAQHQVTHIPTIRLSYEENEKLSLIRDPVLREKFLLREIRRQENSFDRIRARLLEKLKSTHIPFHENDRIFQAKGKKKQLTPEKLLAERLPSLYQPDIDFGSESLISPADIKYLMEVIKTLFNELDALSYLGPDTRNKKNRIRRTILNSVRLHSLFSNSRLTAVGDAIPWHAVDTAVYFLLTVININKKRALRGCPLSTARFDPRQRVDDSGEFQYYPGTICEAVLGILLHRFGDYHQKIHQLLSSRPILDPEDQASLKKIRLLQSGGHVTRNLLSNRSDISSITKMICFMQHEYPDGTGFPRLNENRHLHELLRIFQIVDFFDEMTHPTLARMPYSRFEVIQFMKQHSGEYRYNSEQFVPQARFDSVLLEEFLQILAPYAIGEKVYLYPPGKRNQHYFVGRVFSYLDAHIPLISVLADERNNRKYRHGELLFYIPGRTALGMKNGKPVKQIKMDWIGNLELFDLSSSPGNISEYRDPVFGSTRTLSRRAGGQR